MSCQQVVSPNCQSNKYKLDICWAISCECMTILQILQILALCWGIRALNSVIVTLHANPDSCSTLLNGPQ